MKKMPTREFIAGFVLWISTATFASDEKALLAAIQANPDEDAARLVYADWLQEHGQEDRAEFIRLQIELARRGERSSPDAKSRRAHELLETHQAEWTPKPLRGNASFGDLGLDEVVVWRRGFIESVRVNRALLDKPSVRKAIDALPGLMAIRLSEPYSSATLERLESLKAIDRIRTFHADFPLGEAWRPLLLKLRRLEDLRFVVDDHEYPHALADFLGSSTAERLTRLDMTFPNVRGQHFPRFQEHVTASPHLRRLESLLVSSMGYSFNLSAQAWRNFDSNSNLGNLRNVELNVDQLAPFSSLIATKRFATLRLVSGGVRTGLFPPEFFDQMTKKGSQLMEVMLWHDGDLAALPKALNKHLIHNREQQGCTEIVYVFSMEYY